MSRSQLESMMRVNLMPGSLCVRGPYSLKSLLVALKGLIFLVKIVRGGRKQ